MRLVTETLHPSSAATAFLSDSRTHWWPTEWRSLPSSGLNSGFNPNPNDVLHTHASVSSPLTGTKSRNGAGSLQTVGPPLHLLHLLLQLILLLLQATWRFELSVGPIGRYDSDAPSARRLWITAQHQATSLHYCKRLILHRQPGRLLENRTTVTQAVIRRITLNHFLLFSTHTCYVSLQLGRPGCHPMFDPYFTLPSNHEGVIPRNQPTGNQEAAWVHPVFLQRSPYCWMAT